MKDSELKYLFSRFGEVMTPNEVATTVRCSASYIYFLLEHGYLPCFRIGRHYRVLKSDVIACLSGFIAHNKPYHKAML